MKENLKDLIAKGKADTAIQELLQITKDMGDSELQEEVLLQSAKYQSYTKAKRQGSTTQGEQQISISQINQALLQIIDELPGKITAKYKSNVNTAIGLSKKRSWWQWAVGCGVIIGILAGIAEFTGFSLKELFGDKSAIASNTVMVKAISQNDIPLPPKGTVYLTYGNAQISKELNNHNEAIFTEVPNGYFVEGSQVKITFDDPQGEPYYAAYEDSIYQLQFNHSIDLLVILKGLDRLYGIVKDFNTGSYIQGARVSVLNLETFSDKNGWWELEIKDDNKKRKFHTVRASKDGYRNWEQANIPAQTEKEIAILLKTK